MDNVNWHIFQAAATLTAGQVPTGTPAVAKSVFRDNYAMLLAVARELDEAAAEAARLDRMKNPPQSFVGTYP